MYSMSPYLPPFKKEVLNHPPPPLNRARHQMSSHAQQYSLQGRFTHRLESTWTGDGHFPLYIQWG